MRFKHLWACFVCVFEKRYNFVALLLAYRDIANFSRNGQNCQFSYCTEKNDTINSLLSFTFSCKPICTGISATDLFPGKKLKVRTKKPLLPAILNAKKYWSLQSCFSQNYKFFQVWTSSCYIYAIFCPEDIKLIWSSILSSITSHIITPYRNF